MQKNKKTYECKKCNFMCKKIRDWERHIKTKKHLRDRRAFKGFKCEICKYRTDRKSSYDKHLLTNKHRISSVLEKEENTQKKINKLNEKLRIEKRAREEERKEAIRERIEVNSTLKTAIEKGMGAKTINNTINANKTININVFLNENCKNAMNLEDFVNKLTVGLEDIEYAIENGGPKAISRLLLKNLKKLSPTERPIHCSDEKRAKFYIKDKLGGWEKDEKKPKSSSLDWQLSRTQHKFADYLREWSKENNEGLLANRGAKEAFWLGATQVIYGMRDDFPRLKRKVKRQIAPDVLLRKARHEAAFFMISPEHEDLGNLVAKNLKGYDPIIDLDQNKVLTNIKIN